jgi:hypothetical protein
MAVASATVSARILANAAAARRYDKPRLNQSLEALQEPRDD